VSASLCAAICWSSHTLSKFAGAAERRLSIKP
jgi:hypothetical protein